MQKVLKLSGIDPNAMKNKKVRKTFLKALTEVFEEDSTLD